MSGIIAAASLVAALLFLGNRLVTRSLASPPGGCGDGVDPGDSGGKTAGHPAYRAFPAPGNHQPPGNHSARGYAAVAGPGGKG